MSSRLRWIRFESLTLPATGQLQLSGVDVNAGDLISYGDIDAGLLTYTDDYADTALTYRVSDGTAESLATYTLTLQTNDLSLAPVASEDRAVVIEGGQVVVDVLANDLANALGPFTVDIVDYPKHGSVTIDGSGRLVYTHDGSESLGDRINYQITNSDGLSDGETLVIQVIPMDDPATTTADRLVTQLDTKIPLDESTILANDFDPDSSISDNEIIIVQAPKHGTIQRDAGRLLYVPDAAFVNVDQFVYKLRNAGGESNPSTVEISTTTALPPILDSGDDRNREEEPVGGGNPALDPNVPVEEPVPGPSNDPDADGISDQRTQPGANIPVLTVGYRAPVEADAGIASISTNEFDLQIQSVTTTYISPDREGTIPLVNLVAPGLESTRLDSRDDEFQASAEEIWFRDVDAGSVAFSQGLSIGLSEIAFAGGVVIAGASTIAWALRGSAVVSLFVSHTPAYSYFDISAILESSAGKNESIESIVDQ